MIKYILYPISIVYNFVSILNKKFTKQTDLKVPVVSVGNITWGGSGKTPIVMELAKSILELNKMPVILSRGYARKNTKQQNVVVRTNKLILSDLENSGDEPYMMAQSIECPIIIGSNRVKSAQIAKEYTPDIFILDDGFQHWKIKRDLDIVCVNALNPFGNRQIIPAGILRENISNLNRADVIILTNCNLADKSKLEKLKEEIFNITKKQPICSYCKADKLVNMKTGKQLDFSNIDNNTKFTVVSAIGSPDNFVNTVNSLSLNIKEEVIFQDHHKYTQDDINDIVKTLDANEYILTTAKDAVKIKDVIKGSETENKIFVLNISVNFEDGKQDLINRINYLLNKEMEFLWNVK